MTGLWQRLRDLWTVPRFAALVLLVAALLSVVFIARPIDRNPTGPTEDRGLVFDTATSVSIGEASGRNDLPVPVVHTAEGIRASLRARGWRVHVSVEGSNIKVVFPHELAVCVWVPVIVEGPKGPALVSC